MLKHFTFKVHIVTHVIDGLHVNIVVKGLHVKFVISHVIKGLHV